MQLQSVLKTAILALAVSSLALAQQKGAALGVFAGASDIGKTKTGSTVYDAASKSYKVTGGGADMWGAADDFHIAWVKLSGDASIAADIHFPAGNLNPLEKAVLILRQSLEPGAAYADNAIHADGHITLQYRATEGGKTADVTATERNATRLKIERKGNQFTASIGSSDDKMTPFSTQTIELKDPVFVGLGVCAHNADGLVDVTFSNVKIERKR